MSTLAAQTSSTADLGDVTTVAGKEYLIKSELGRGAFGKVWLVRQQSAGLEEQEFALKVMEMRSEDKTAIQAARFEVEVLKHLSNSLPQGIKDSGRVPLYVGHSVSSDVSGKTCIACVMTRLNGGPLDQWLYGVDEEVHKHIDPEKLLNGALQGGKVRSMSLSAACSTSIDLLTNLCPVLSTLSSYAFHRDICSHNVLVHQVKSARDSSLTFAMIDFGLATNAKTWSGLWKTSNICGDPRYWTPGAWMNLEFGWKYLETHPNSGFVRQYKERLDHFGVGVFVLELFFALWNRSDDSSGNQIELVQDAWHSYWKLSIQTFQDFHKTDIVSLRKKLTRAQTVSQLHTKLQTLRSKLQEFAQKVPNHIVTPLFTVCADLIYEWGTLSWDDIARDARKPPSSGKGAVVNVTVEPVKKPSHRRVRTQAGSCDFSDVQEVGVNMSTDSPKVKPSTKAAHETSKQPQSRERDQKIAHSPPPRIPGYTNKASLLTPQTKWTNGGHMRANTSPLGEHTFSTPTFSPPPSGRVSDGRVYGQVLS
jgi:serine/threonine protein kinase